MGIFCASTGNAPSTSPCSEGDSAVTRVWGWEQGRQAAEQCDHGIHWSLSTETSCSVTWGLAYGLGCQKRLWFDLLKGRGGMSTHMLLRALLSIFGLLLIPLRKPPVCKDFFGLVFAILRVRSQQFFRLAWSTLRAVPGVGWAVLLFCWCENVPLAPLCLVCITKPWSACKCGESWTDVIKELVKFP